MVTKWCNKSGYMDWKHCKRVVFTVDPISPVFHLEILKFWFSFLQTRNNSFPVNMTDRRSPTVQDFLNECRQQQRVRAVLNSLGSRAWALFILWGGGCGGGIEESSLCVVGAAGLVRVVGRGPLIQRCVLPFMRNVTKAVLLRGASLHRVQSQAALHQRLWVRVLDLETGRKNKHVVLLKLNQLQYFTVKYSVVPHLTPGFTGSGTCGMLSRFGDGTAAGAPMSLTVKQTQNISAYRLRRGWTCSTELQVSMRKTKTCQYLFLGT